MKKMKTIFLIMLITLISISGLTDNYDGIYLTDGACERKKEYYNTSENGASCGFDYTIDMYVVEL